MCNSLLCGAGIYLPRHPQELSNTDVPPLQYACYSAVTGVHDAFPCGQAGEFRNNGHKVSGGAIDVQSTHPFRLTAQCSYWLTEPDSSCEG